MDSPSLACRRCFCNEVEQERQKGGKLRVMGTLVGVVRLHTTNIANASNQNDNDNTTTTTTAGAAAAADTTTPSEDEDMYTQVLVLDDGTGSHVHCLASDQMVQCVTLGMTLDCVARNPLRRRRRRTQNDAVDKNDDAPPLVMDMLIIRPEGTQALTLRGLEIMHYRQGCPGQTWGLTAHNNKKKQHKSVPSFTMQDINDIIQAEAEMGVSLDDLHEMFRVDKHELQEMIQELQMQGLIYQSNKNGAYLPL